jgi:peptide/nickel transport system permease protein
VALRRFAFDGAGPLAYAVRRIGYAIVIIFLATVVTFLGLHISPGNVAGSVYNLQTTPKAQIAAFEHSLWLDRPLPVQFVHYLGQLLSGNFGFSYVQRLPVTTIVSNSASYTLELAAAAFLLTFAIGVPLGVLAAIRRGGILDWGVRTFVGILISIPNFVLALLLILFVSVRWKLLPVSGATSFNGLILPTIVLAAEPLALTVRITRTAMLEQLGGDFARTLRARGVRDRRINWRHVLRNALNPIISLGAVQIRTLLGYTLIVEVIFRWPGLGTQLVNSILQRDYAVAQILAILLAVVVVIASALGDVALRWADPRIRVSAKAG